MKSILKWFARVMGSALSLVLFIVLLPYASRFVGSLIPDLSGAAVNTSVTLSHKLAESARLECTTVDDEGVIVSSVNAALIGAVQDVKISYQYHASVGIDLKKVQINTQDNRIIFTLPEPEILADSLVQTSISKNDFWYPLTEERHQKLIDDERANKRQAVLEEMNTSDKYWENTVHAFETTIAQWVELNNNGLTFEYVPAGA